MAAEPEFINTDPAVILAELIAAYEAETGKTLQPGQVERLLINAFAYREGLVRQAIQDAAVQNLVDFSTAPVLDYLASLVGVTRLPAEPAECVLYFECFGFHGDESIPSGTRVSTEDGKVFATTADTFVPAAETFFSVPAVCLTIGVAGNGYIAGSVDQLLDPLAFIFQVSNVAETNGGSEAETDEQLRTRIKLAPGQYSNAGSRAAYRYHAMSAHVSIIDVAVLSNVPGTVEVYPHVASGSSTPTEVLDAVTAALSAETVRPLTDTVLVESPTPLEYDFFVRLTMYDWADSDALSTLVEAALFAFRDAKRNTMGANITKAMILGVIMTAEFTEMGMYTADAFGGAANDHTGTTVWSDVECDEHEFPLAYNGQVYIGIETPVSG